MRYGDHITPPPLKDEDKWWKLTKRQWIIILPMVLIGVGIWTLFSAINLLPVGISFIVILGCIDLFIAFGDLPEDKYLYVAGVKPEKLLLRVLLKKLPFNKKIYTKNLDNGYKRWNR